MFLGFLSFFLSVILAQLIFSRGIKIESLFFAVVHIIELAIYLIKEECRRHWIIVASYTETPLGVSNQRSLFAKRGKVNGWVRYGYINASL